MSIGLFVTSIIVRWNVFLLQLLYIIFKFGDPLFLHVFYKKFIVLNFDALKLLNRLLC
jgi:hypothetical protein